MTPDLAAVFAPMTTRASESDRERHWRALHARLERTEREIKAVLAAIQSRTPAAGPQHRICPTPLELTRLEAARVRREGIEQEMQTFLDELDEPR